MKAPAFLATLDAGLMIELDIGANVALSPPGQFEVVLTSANGGACHYHPTALAGQGGGFSQGSAVVPADAKTVGRGNAR